MRRALVLPLLLIAACNDTAYRSLGEPDTEPTGPLFTISGEVSDSLSGAVLAGVRVASGQYVTETDAGGAWSLTVPGGAVTVTTSPTGYERSSFSFTLRTNAYVSLSARRLAPLVQECTRNGLTVSARIIDLQGRKTIERWQRSEAFVLDPAGEYRIGAPAWSYRALDYETWEVSLSPVAAVTQAIRWNVYDAEGHVYSGICEPVTPPPSD